MSNMKCPFCNLDIRTHRIFTDGCDNTHSLLWQELIRTRKALDAAKKWLMKIGYLNMEEHGLGSEKMMTNWCKTVALHGLKEIETALEQKDVK